MSIELGHVELLGVDTIGQPGQRRFYLFARSWRGSTLMWMEKEQLNRLSLTLDRALAQLTEGQVLRTMFTFTVAPLEIVMDQGQEPLALVHEEEAVSFLFTHKQAQDLSSTINVLMTGGRPVCPLCQTPLDEGPHACVKQNGHHEIVQIVEAEDEEEE